MEEEQQGPVYMRGFVHGMHFVLLALHGRLTSRPLDRAAIAAIMEEYFRMVEDYRDSFEAPAATAIALRYEDEPPQP